VWELYCSLSICLNLFCFRGSACFAYDKTVINRPITSLGHQEGRRVFWEGPKLFKLCPMVLNYVQLIFTGGLCPPGYGPGHKSTQGWKVSFWESVRRKFSVNSKMNNFVGKILQNKYYDCCYTLLSGTRPKRGYTPICGTATLLRWNWCRNLAAVNCILHWIVLTLSTLHTRNSSCITLLWLHLHHNHKMSTSYHKSGWVSGHQSVAKFLCVL